MATHSTSASRVPARPSSSTSDGLFGALYARGAVAAAVADAAWLRAMLDVEAALARACAAEELVPKVAAEAIAAACAGDDLDLAAIGREAGRFASPVVPLVHALRERVGGAAAEHVHAGATSQDVIDTATMLVARRALEPLLADAAGAAAACARLADAHRATPMAGRTLLQLARPTTFGLRAAGWLAGLDEARAALAAVRDGTLAVQMGGPVGRRQPAVAARVAAALELAEPVLPWHAIRVRPAALAAALAALAGVLAKVARDVTLLAQDEVGEVREGGEDRGGSSAMAHKRNPVAAVSVLACAERTPGLAATVLAAMAQEHERAAGAWQAEWGTLTDLLRLTGSAAAWGRDLLEHLEVDPDRMAANVAALEARADDATTGEAPARRGGAARRRAADEDGADVLVDRALAAHAAVGG